MKIPVAQLVCILIGSLLACCAGGCSSGPRAVAPWNGTVAQQVIGDWDDVWPALIIAGRSGEVGLLEARDPREEDGQQIQEWIYLTVRDEEMVARASRSPGAKEIRLEAQGGDEVVARRLVRTWAQRVAALQGREWAPL